MLPISPIGQLPGHCGPASLRMVLHYYGIYPSDKELASRAKASTSKGTSPPNMVKAARSYGLNAKWIQNSSFAQINSFLKKKIPVIVDWYAVDDENVVHNTYLGGDSIGPPDGHYCVVVGLDSKNIFLADPEYVKIRKVSRKIFYQNWFDFSADFIRTKKDLHLRGIIIIEPRKKKN